MSPKIRIRRVGDRRGWFRIRPLYEVELTEGAQRQVIDTVFPGRVLDKHLHMVDSSVLINTALDEWDGTSNSEWTTYPGQ